MKIDKTKLKLPKSCKLSKGYTLEEIQPLLSTLLDESYNEFANIIQEEIDREIVLKQKVW